MLSVLALLLYTPEESLLYLLQWQLPEPSENLSRSITTLQRVMQYNTIINMLTTVTQTKVHRRESSPQAIVLEPSVHHDHFVSEES